MALGSFILLMFALDMVAADAQLVQRARLRHAVSACNTSVIYNKVLLKHVTLLSKYVFTGKVFGVKSGYNGTRIYKVNIRRVLKGDLNDIGVLVKFGTAKSLRFSDATIFVESSSISCPPLRVRTYGIFLTEKRRYGGTLWLSLVIEPLVLTLRSLGIIEAVVKVTAFAGKLETDRRDTYYHIHADVPKDSNEQQALASSLWKVLKYYLGFKHGPTIS